MAFYDLTRPADAGRLRRAVTDLTERFFNWRESREARKALSRLSDHELDDIGLIRSDLDGFRRKF